MAKTFDFVNHPKDFESEFMREMIPPVPDQDPKYRVETYYLAVFDKDINYPTEEEYKALLEEQLRVPAVVDAVLTMPPREQFGFGTDTHHVTISVYTFRPSPGTEDEAPFDMEILTMVHVDDINANTVH